MTADLSHPDAPLNTNSRLAPEQIWAMPVQERLVKLNWLGNMWRSDSGTPFLAADFIGRLGRSVSLVDVRDADELTGPLGHIPGSHWVPLEEQTSVGATSGAAPRALSSPPP